MRSTRSSSRLAGSSQPSADSTKSSPPQATNGNGAGQKRKAESSPAQPKKTGRKPGRPKKQKTIEETMPDVDKEENDDEKEEESEVKEGGLDDVDMKDAAEEAEAGQKEEVKEGDQKRAEAEIPASSTNGVKDATKDEDPTAEAAATGDGETTAANGTEHKDEPDASAAPTESKEEKPKSGEESVPDSKTTDTASKVDHTDSTKPSETTQTTTDNALEDSKERSSAQSSTILEKGLIYFFLRGRVTVDTVTSVQDIARTYMVLRPLPSGAKLSSGTVPDQGNARLLALPKKVLPRSHRDQFMTFVEKVGASIKDLKEDFMEGSTYDTKTTGVRHSPAVTPVGEGVYALTNTGRETHLAYLLTIPSEIGEVQQSLGLASKGSFVTSLKNPEAKGPANATLDHPAEFSEDVQAEFRGRRWMPCRPEHLDVVNAQVLLIGEASGDLGGAVEKQEEAGGKEGSKKEDPEKEMETLEEEDALRVEGLVGEEAEAVFKDLGISKEEFPELLTTW